MQDRRRYVRVPAGVDSRCEVLKEGGSAREAGSARNFSVGGLCLVLQERHDPGTVLKLAFRLGQNDEVVAVLGRVAWIEEFRVGSGVSYDTGIAFLAVPETEPEKKETGDDT